MATKKTTDNKATANKTTKKEVAKTTEKKVVEKDTKKKEVENKRKTNSVKQMSNSEMKALFNDNGCATYTKANDTSNVVYNTFGTKSRVLQQGKAYQLLLTNGHKKVKEEIVDCDNDDVARFKEFYEKLSDEEKAMVLGYDTIEVSKLSASELPRERSVKVNDFDVLVKFIKYMGTFEENKVTA